MSRTPLFLDIPIDVTFKSGGGRGAGGGRRARIARRKIMGAHLNTRPCKAQSVGALGTLVNFFLVKI